MKVDLLYCHRIGISRILTREIGNFGGSVAQKCFVIRCKNQTEPFNMTQNVFKNDFLNFNGSLMW